jgi:hypothetical protein
MKYYKRFIVNTVLGMILLVKTTSGQQGAIPNPFANLSAPSPTTAALAKFTEVPVSGFTGSPNISIPLYEINTSFTKLPISLNYQAAGITVDQEATNVGLGWSLNAGGVVSRSVFGKADDGSYQMYRMDRQSIFNVNDPVDYSQAQSLFDNSIDGVPDLYSYTLPGYAGKFIIADQIRQLPLTNLRITERSEGGFDIIAPDGNKYVFDATETSRNRTDGGATTNTVGWYLTKILSADRSDSVVFTYANTRYVNGSGRSFTREFYQANGNGWGGLGAYSENSFTNQIFGKQLTRIDFNQGSVEFNISWNTREDIASGTDFSVPLVSSVVVKNKSGTALRTISLRYGYFTNGRTTQDDKRLKLSGVYINGGNSTDTLKAQRYNLFYDGIELPSKSSFSQDHWGYYNGVNNSTLLPSYTTCVNRPAPPNCYSCLGQPSTLTFDGADRETRGQFAAAGMLERITYPTGGYTSFEWEPHDVLNYEAPTTTYSQRDIGSAESHPAGTSFVTDSSADYYVNPSTYPQGICGAVYGAMEIPSGSWDDDVLITHASGSAIVYKRAGRVPVAVLNFNFSPSYEYNFSTNFNLEAGQSYFVVTKVRHMGFSVNANMTASVETVVTVPNKVVGGCRIKKVTFLDPVAGKSLVKTYEYRMPGDTVHSSGRIHRIPMYDRTIMRFEQQGKGCDYFERFGIRLTSNSLTSLGSGSHVGYSYVKENIGVDGANGYIISNYANMDSENEFNATWRVGYLQSKATYNAQSQLVSKERNVYSSDTRGDTAFIGSTVDYFVQHPCSLGGTYYPAFGGGKEWIYPSEWFHLDSTITDVYDQDVPSRLLTTSTAFVYNNVKHLQASSISERNSENLDLITSFRYPQDYTLPSGTLTAEAQAIKDLQAANMHSMVESYKQKKLASGVLQTQSATYMAYKSVASAKGPVVLFDKQYAAEVTFPSGTFTPSVVSGNGIAKNSAYALEATVAKYDVANNIAEAEKRGGDVNAYLWDYNSNYMVAQFRNARLADVAFSSFEAEGKGNWSYAGANVADVNAITGKSCYNIGAGAVSKTGLTAATSYTVSYWTKNAAPYTITGTAAGYPLKGETVNGWTYYEHKISGQSTVTVSGTGFIDELRLYPTNATAVTYTYDPLVGATSICNEGNKINYYLYDSDGRLAVIKDQDGKILKQIDYQYQASINK